MIGYKMTFMRAVNAGWDVFIHQDRNVFITVFTKPGEVTRTGKGTSIFLAAKKAFEGYDL